MKRFLLVDFGATRIKTAVVDLNSGKLSSFGNFTCPPNVSKKLGQYELSLKLVKERFRKICESYSDKRIEGIMLCSQMHGFIILDKNNEPLTEYISWMDERSLEPVKGISTYDLIRKNLGGQFLKITGMNPRPGLPFMNILHLARQGKLTRHCKVLSLPEWLVNRSTGLVHDTMAASLGFYDISMRKYSKELVNFAESEAGVKFIFNKVVSDIEVAGYWKDIPVYTAVGDLQCAIFGAGNILNTTVSVNIGTGSQVSVIVKDRPKFEIEARPYFGGNYLKTVTHIPAGRALAVFLGLINDQKVRVWKEIKKLKVSDIVSSSLNFDLAVFKSAWNYSSGGSIGNIHEGNFNRKNYLASLIKNLLNQYVVISKELVEKDKTYIYILSGGIPKRIPVIKKAFSKMTGTKVIQTSNNIDETIHGLRKLAIGLR
uniref:Carbohydrate kinase FGGY N-terminal domain-containing protein n=1 Tax=candidate division CPR3 bacterium TaxID=2268181 RepID=A0A7V3J950_UNCC3